MRKLNLIEKRKKSAQEIQDEIFKKMPAGKKIELTAKLSAFCLKLNSLPAHRARGIRGELDVNESAPLILPNRLSSLRPASPVKRGEQAAGNSRRTLNKLHGNNEYSFKINKNF